MKLVSPRLELTTIKTLCSRNKGVAGFITGSIDKDCFGFDPTREAFDRIMTLARLRGEMPDFGEICVDPVLSEETREALLNNDAKQIRTKKKAKFLIDHLIRYKRARGLYMAANKTLKMLSEDEVNVDNLMDNNSKMLMKLRSRSDIDSSLLHIGRGNNSKKLVEKLLNNEKPSVIPSGFQAYDESNGGFILGSMVVIASSTGAGKSTMVNQILMNTARNGYDSVLVPLELGDQESMTRILANLGEVDTRKFFLKKITKNEKSAIRRNYVKYATELKEAGARYSLFIPSEDMTAEEIFFCLIPYGYKVIVIDYVSLLKGVDDDDIVKALRQVSRFSKIFAKTHNIVVVLVAQLSDEGKVKYSRALGENADNVWIWDLSKESKENGIIEIQQLKARNQKVFPFTLDIRYDIMKIKDHSDEPTSGEVSASNKWEKDYLDDV